MTAKLQQELIALGKEFELLTKIGSGGFGTVYKARSTIDQSLHAVKVIPLRSEQGRDNSKDIIQELAVIRELDHPSIIRIHKCYLAPESAHIVFELAPHGDLEGFLYKATTFPEKEAKIVTAEIGRAIQYLHDKKIIHRDIKLANVLIASDGGVRLADFGLAAFASSEGKTSGICGTEYAQAPEMLTEQFYGDSVDWWALGVMLYQLVVGKLPFEASDGKTLQENIISGPLVIPSSVPPDCREVIEGLLNKDVELRTNSTAALFSLNFFHDAISDS